MTIRKKELLSIIKYLYPSFSSRELLESIESIISSAKRQRPKYLLDWDKRLDKSWYRKSENIMYVVYADLFVCDSPRGQKIEGLIERLDYFEELGITNVHILPILASSGDAGFAVDDYRKIDPSIGTMAQFRKLTRIAYKKGIKITFDLVLNHVSDNHIWARQLKKGNKKYLNYFIIDETKTGKSGPRVLDIFPEFAPGHWDYVPEIDEYVWATFYSKYPIKGKKYNNFAQWDLNYRNPKILLKMIENMLFLANCGVDMFRFDAVFNLWKEEGTSCCNLPQVYELLKIFYYALQEVAPKRIILGEECVSSSEILRFLDEGKSMQIAYNFLSMTCLWHAIITSDTSLLKKAIRYTRYIPRGCNWIVFDGCHDEINLNGIELNLKGKEGKKITRLLFNNLTKDGRGVPFRFNEDTDEYGYGVSGTKWSLLGGDLAQSDKEIVFKKIMLMNAFKLSIGGVPLFYQGEEIGLSNDYSYKKDPRKKMDSRFVKRQKITDKVRNRLKKKGTKEEQIFAGLKKLIEIRKSYKVFGEGEIKVSNNKNSKLLVFERRLQKEKLLVVINFSGKKQTYLLKSDYKDLLSNKKVEKQELEVSPYEYRWFLQC